MGIAIADCIQTWWWYPHLAGDRVTQHPHASKAMLTAVGRDEHPSPSRSSVYANRQTTPSSSALRAPSRAGRRHD